MYYATFCDVFIVDLEQVNLCRVSYFTERDKINYSLYLTVKHLTYLYHLKSIFYPVNLILYYGTLLNLLLKVIVQIHVFNSFKPTTYKRHLFCNSV